MVFCAVPATADMANSITIADATELTPGEMQRLRGGFIDPTGLIYSFAVNVQTALNGTEVFTRQVVVSPGTGGEFQGSVNNNLLARNVDGMRVSIIKNGAGVTAVDRNGLTTTLLNETETGIPSSIVINNGNDRNIAQSVEMTLKLNSIASTFAQTRAAANVARRATMHDLGF